MEKLADVIDNSLSELGDIVNESLPGARGCEENYKADNSCSSDIINHCLVYRRQLHGLQIQFNDYTGHYIMGIRSTLWEPPDHQNTTERLHQILQDQTKQKWLKEINV